VSFAIAIHDKTFLFYAYVVLGALGITGILLLLLKKKLGEGYRPIARTYLGWLIICPFIFLFMLWGRAAVITGVTLISIFSFKELAKATGLYKDWLMVGVAYLAIIATGIFTLMRDPRLNKEGWYGMFMIVPIYFTVCIMLIPILRTEARGQFQKIAISLVGFIYLGWMFGHIGFLANSDNPYGYILYLLFAVSVSDIAAFIFGRLFGKHKLRSNISPNKTLEGSLGAFAVSMILPWVMAFSFPHFGPLQKVLTGIIIGLGGQFGDLSISMIKRDIGIKNMGSMLPGHGGLLDRIDSLILTAPLWFHLIRWFYDI